MTKPFTPLARGASIGIIGGGQLGRMLAISAARYGFKTVVLEPQIDCPAAQMASQQIIAAYDDVDALTQLARDCDVVTYEFENVDADAAEHLVAHKPVFPPPSALRISQDRLIEKDFLQKAGLETAPYRNIENGADLRSALREFGNTGILKTRRLGYDGKGQIRFDGSQTDAGITSGYDALHGAPGILEGFVDFACEISVIVTRGRDGTVSSFDPARNVHQDGILARSTVPCGLDEEIVEVAQRKAQDLAHALAYVGTLGLELFVTHDGKLLANEFAPRVHNSGHWTEAACALSQFDMHIRAIAGWALPPVIRHSDCIMHNLLGNQIDDVARHGNEGATVWHDYGKAEARAGRKMGHFTTIKPKNQA